MNDWFAGLAPTVEPMVEPERLPSGDWRQDAAYDEPLWTGTAAELARRISIENLGGFYALQLLWRYDPGPRAAEIFAAAGWSGRRQFHLASAESTHPLEEGFLRRVRLWHDRRAPAPEQPGTVDELFAAFTRAEEARIGEIEPWLRARYGKAPPELPLFDWIDYPVFDCGTMVLAYAILVHGAELHFWSRAAHAHK